MIQEHEKNFRPGESLPDPAKFSEQIPIEDDSDTLEPFVEENEHREINADDPLDLAHWAQQFQISVDDLKAAMVLNGNSVKEIKKYLSV